MMQNFAPTFLFVDKAFCFRVIGTFAFYIWSFAYDIIREHFSVLRPNFLERLPPHLFVFVGNGNICDKTLSFRTIDFYRCSAKGVYHLAKNINFLQIP